MTAWAGKHAKLLSFITGAIVSVATQVYGSSNHWVLAVALAATGLGVYIAPNTQGSGK